MHTEFWWKNLKKGDHLVGLNIDGRIKSKQKFKKQEWTVETRLIWPMMQANGEFLLTW
jgi:hypothetical protein